MIRRLRAFTRLPRADRRIVLRAIAALVGSRFRPHTRGHEGRSDVARAQHIASLLVRTAGALPFHTSCLQRATALASLLEREGIACELRIAVRREGETVDAHAWVEHEGVELLMPAEEGWVALLSSGDASSE